MWTMAMPAVLALWMGLSACAGTRAAGPAERFDLVEVGGRPLPVSYPEERGCREEVLRATLALRPGGEWEMEMAKRETCGDRVEEDEDVERGTYTADGGAYRFAGPRPSAAADAGEIEIEALVDGTLDGDVLTARLHDGTTVVFRRS